MPNSRGRKRKMKALSRWLANSPVFIVFLLLLAIVMIGGGGSRADIQSLLFVRPIAALCLAFGLIHLTKADVVNYRWLYASFAALVLLCVLHLVPLPPSQWTTLPGRGLVVEVSEVIGIEPGWRSFALVPWRGYNWLASLVVPAAALVLAVQLPADKAHALVFTLIVFGVLSAMLGLLQIIGSTNSPLYLYRITNEGAPVGLFANRNHNALFLAMLIPACATYVSLSTPTPERLRHKRVIAMLCLALMIPVLLVARSRAGLILAGFGFAASFFLYRAPQVSKKARRQRRRFHPLLLPSVGITTAFAVVIALAGRATGFGKIFEAEAVDSTRQTIWETTVEAIHAFLPFGSGIGSFVEVYQIFEKKTTLRPEYVNHAHNDYLEFALEGGVVAIIFMMILAAAFLFAAVSLLRKKKYGSVIEWDDLLVGRLGVVMLLQLAVASLADYPARTPIIAVVAIIATVWIARAMAAQNKLARRANHSRALDDFETGNKLT